MHKHICIFVSICASRTVYLLHLTGHLRRLCLDKAFWFVFPAGLFQNHFFFRPLLYACLCEKSPANISICRQLCLPFSFQWISNGFFKWSLRYIRPFKAWPKRGWDGKKLGLRAGSVTLTSWTIWRTAQCMTQSFFIWYLAFFLSHQNLPALNLWCCSEKNPVFKSDKTDKWFKCFCGEVASNQQLLKSQLPWVHQ